MPRVERAKNPSLEQLQQAQAQHRLVMETPQIPPFDQGNLRVLTDHLEKLASLENRRQKVRQKSKLAIDNEEKAAIRASETDLRARQRSWRSRMGRACCGSSSWSLGKGTGRRVGARSGD